MLRIGGGAGFAGDRIEPAVDLVERGELDWLVLECLAERTIALGRARVLRGGVGFDPLLPRRIEALVPALRTSPTRVITNAGSADPVAAMHAVVELLARSQLDLDVVALCGDSVLDAIDPHAPAWEDGRPLIEHGELVAANAYLGAEHVRTAIETGASIVITGRVADPSLFVAPLVSSYGWAMDDWDALARATVVGHLLECGAQVTGGYHADPPHVAIDGLERLGFPIAEVASDGTAVVTKLPGTGGRVDLAGVTEQLLYEVLDPSAYLTPDVAADFTTVQLRDLGGDRVAISGATGRARPDELKVSVGYRSGWLCEAEISYAGATSVERARLAGRVVGERLQRAGLSALRVELLGVDSLLGPGHAAAGAPRECRLRVAGTGSTRAIAEAVGEEVTALYTNGPSGGGGVRVATEERIGVLSTTIPRDRVEARVVRSERRASR